MSPVMGITLVKAAWPGGRDRACLTADGVTWRGPVHVIHDLPHLVAESLFGITDGLWGELAAGPHAAASQAATARDPKRHKQGRIVSGAAVGAPAQVWLTLGHRRAKTITNCVANRWGDGPDTAGGVRDRVAREHDPSLDHLLARVGDDTITMAIRGVRDLEQRWMAVPPGGTLRLSWPLTPDVFTGTGNPATGPDHGQRGTEHLVRARLFGGAFHADYRAERTDTCSLIPEQEECVSGIRAAAAGSAPR
jgi:hypothetical protein